MMEIKAIAREHLVERTPPVSAEDSDPGAGTVSGKEEG